MKKILFTVVLSISIALGSSGQVDPNKNIDEGKIEGNTYTSNEIGWKMEIPTGWAVVEKEKTKENNEKGLKALQETMDAEIDYSGLKNLISIQKDLFNIFQSTSEPFKVEYEGEWEENSAALKEIIYLTYLDQGIKTDSSATTTEVIDGLEFQKYSFTVYSPNGKFILSQIMYSRLINGFDFGVNINYNNDKYRDELLMAFRNSKFKKD
ncbi:hypothetical protein [Aquiflexum gelatinilyticum]|uniref:hypothetical protein n=1 Tax=Aquiflexum gelatinilyticum TaxID=2961943 RepID=UPI00216A6217|nr:hypothetical protein [Aquiflexum gelatinilyticum]MCS4436690.1 hypothetical protein [Aquiflexum gelatinilyticum]